MSEDITKHDLYAWNRAIAKDLFQAKWWQFRKIKKLEKMLFASYLAITGRPEKACDVLKSLTPTKSKINEEGV